MPFREPAQARSSGAMARIPLRTRELVPGQPRSGRIARPKAELGVEPPGAGFERFVVAELIRIEAERGGTEHVPQRGQPSHERERRFATAKGVEGVERKRRAATDDIGLVVADGHAVAQRKAAVVRRHGVAPLRDHADERHGQAIVMVDEPRVARVCEREGLQRAMAHDHRGARQLDDRCAVAHRHPPQRKRRSRDLGTQIGAKARQRVATKHHRRSGEVRGGSRRRVRSGREHKASVHDVRIGFAREPVAGHGGKAPQQERGVCFVRAAKPVECGIARQLQLAQRARLRRRHQGRQGAPDALVCARLAAVQPQLVRPPSGQPLRLAGEEAVVHRRTGDAAIGQRKTVRSQVGATIERGKHGLHLRQHRRVVGIGPDEAKGLVQAHDGPGTAEPGMRELLQQRLLLFCHRGSELEAPAFQCGERRR